MSNYMEKVAEMLGVKLGERFKVSSRGHGDVEGCFKADGLYLEGSLNGIVLIKMPVGEYTIEKLPWKPQYGDRYWAVSMNGDVLYDEWNGYVYDYAMYYAGNCFETEEEAKEHAPEVIEKLRRKYEEG